MTQPTSSITLRHHLYPDSYYGKTPSLVMPRAGDVASNLARLMVKLGVDGRGPQTEPASAEEQVAAIPRLLAMQQAIGTGFMVDVRLVEPDGTGTVRAMYTYSTNEVGLVVADRPPHIPLGRLFNLRWALDGYEQYELQTSVYARGKDYLDASAEMYASIWSRVMDSNSDSPLEVVRARFRPYPQSSPFAIGVAAVAMQQAS